MDVGAISSAATALSSAQVGDAVGTLVLKKALQAETQSAAQLIDALPTPPSNNPPNLGNKVDLFA